MWPANCQSRAPLGPPPPPVVPVIVPNELADQPAPGPPNVVLFQTLKQFASKTKVLLSLPSGKLRRRPRFRFCVPGFLNLYAAVRGALPIRYEGWPQVAVGAQPGAVETFTGAMNADELMYGIALHPVPMPRLQALKPLGPLP